MTFQHGSVVRTHDGNLGIVLLIDTRTLIFAGGRLRAIQADAVAENPAQCHSCEASRWYWEAAAIPKCRDCEAVSEDWQSELLNRAMSAILVCLDDQEFAADAREVLRRDFEAWDLDRLLAFAGAHALRQHLIRRGNITHE